MIISLNTREKIIALLDRLVAANKIERHTDANNMVSFSPKPGFPLQNEIIVTRDGESVLIDDIIDADEDNILNDWMRFAGANGSVIPLDKIARNASNQVYNEILANILLSIRYNQLKQNGMLKMSLPTITNKEILIARGFFTSDLRESALGYRDNLNINAAVQDLIKFNREQKRTLTMRREKMSQDLVANSTIDASLALKLRNQRHQAEQEFKDNVDKQLQTLLVEHQSLQDTKSTLDKNFNTLPKSFLRKVQKGKLKTSAEMIRKIEEARATKNKTAEFCDLAGRLVGASIGLLLPLPLIGGIVYAFNERAYQKAKREQLCSQTYYSYVPSEQDIQNRLTQVYQEAANYLALLGPEEAARYLALFGIQEITTTTTSTQSYATTSAAMYSSSNPANANAAAHPANLARQLRDAAEGELKVPTKSSSTSLS